MRVHDPDVFMLFFLHLPAAPEMFLGQQNLIQPFNSMGESKLWLNFHIFMKSFSTQSEKYSIEYPYLDFF